MTRVVRPGASWVICPGTRSPEHTLMWSHVLLALAIVALVYAVGAWWTGR